jgi:feruloyl-CoA synthase
MPTGVPAHDVDLETRGDALFVRSRERLGSFRRSMVESLDLWAAAAPERTLFAQRDAEGAWRKVTYREALATARALGQACIDRQLDTQRPLAILSENAIDHALLALGAQYAGVPHVPISPAYALLSTDFAKLRDIMAQITPGLVYAADGVRYATALRTCVPANVEIAASGAACPGRATTSFDDLCATYATDAVDRGRAFVGPDTIAKILFTSGSTGMPKGVVTTQRMLTSNQQMLRQAFPFIVDQPPVIVDWLPWHHTFGGSHNVGLVLTNGGTLYINAGKPISAAAFAPTLANLREIAPTIHFDVPRGFEMLAAALRDDAALRETFFSRLDMLFYAGAAISAPVWRALEEVALAATGGRVFTTTSLGSTETAPAALAASWQTDGPGMVGIPLPGVELKLVDAGGKRELRLRGPNITPGYWRNDALTAAAFDGDGFYCIGDALRFVDEADPSRGFVFDGRIAEDFKLATGTWVSAGPLRLLALEHLAPLVSDLVVSGENRSEIGVLAFANVAGIRAHLGTAAAELEPAALLADAALTAALSSRLTALAARSTGSATRVTRLLLLAEPPSLDAGEITDKGSLNARAILARRAADVARIHAEQPEAPVIALAAVAVD